MSTGNNNTIAASVPTQAMSASSLAITMATPPGNINGGTPFGKSMGQSFGNKPDCNNFTLWKTMVTTVIRGHRLDGFLSGTRSCPPKFLLIKPTGSRLRLNLDYKEWVVNDQLLMGWLYRSITEMVATQVMGSTTSTNLWKALENLYGIHSKLKMNTVRTSIQTIRKGNMTVDDYLKQMKSWADILAIVGNLYPKDQLNANVIYGIDSEYMPIVVLIGSKKIHILARVARYLVEL
ncbi:hypothetical protein LWI29_034062 [Acer saccharum]|uniref:Uncharacterized protein n=1 Tax=Acer saccharum TaxID=4024 RepID=A0AA39RW47_ACESA|nr:hypothetical protein LWI29_034062 [Acer saccharum]